MSSKGECLLNSKKNRGSVMFIVNGVKGTLVFSAFLGEIK